MWWGRVAVPSVFSAHAGKPLQSSFEGAAEEARTKWSWACTVGRSVRRSVLLAICLFAHEVGGWRARGGRARAPGRLGVTVPDTSRRLLAEAVGTGLLVATVVGSGIMAQRLAGGNAALALLCNTLPTGAILVVLVTMLGPVSGAHMNPAVSLVAALRRDLPWRLVGSYCVAQVAGGCLGTLVAHAMFGLDLLQASTTARTGGAQWFAEGVATFTLVLVIIGTLRARSDMIAVNVGLTITATYWFTASTSFANPAVTLARALTDTFAGIRPLDAPAFILAQLAGALAGAGLAAVGLGWGAPDDVPGAPGVARGSAANPTQPGASRP